MSVNTTQNENILNQKEQKDRQDTTNTHDDLKGTRVTTEVEKGLEQFFLKQNNHYNDLRPPLYPLQAGQAGRGPPGLMIRLPSPYKDVINAH